MSNNQQFDIKSEFATSNPFLMDIPMAPINDQAFSDVYMIPAKREEAVLDNHTIPVKRGTVATKTATYEPRSLTKKQKLAIKWHAGEYRYIADRSQLDFVFERFPKSYSKRDKNLLRRAMDQFGELRGRKHEILAGKKGKQSPDRAHVYTSGKRQAKQPFHRSATGANAIPQGIRKSGAHAEKKKRARSLNMAAEANKNQNDSSGSDDGVPPAPRNSPDPAFDAMLETMEAMCLD